MFPLSNHAAVSPSRLARIVDCPGSFRLAQKYESTQSSYAAEGTHLHLATERTIYSLTSSMNSVVRKDIVTPHLDDEQRDAVQDCVDYYLNLLRTLDNPQVQIEAHVELMKFDPVLYECAGTCDIIITTDTEIHVLDWKFGKGIPVYADNNDQCYAYATGATIDPSSLDKYKEIHVHVIQPRLESYDHVVLTPQDLWFWLNSRIIPGVTRAYEKHAPFNPSGESCRWCPAKIGCRARHNFANQTAADVFKMHAAKPGDEVADEEMAKTLANAEVFETYVKDLRLHVQRQIESGQGFIGYKMVHGRSLRRYIDPTDAEEALNHFYDYDQLYKAKFISPAQARKLAGRDKERLAEIDALIEKPEGKPTLVKESDKRAPIEYKTASELFKGMKNEQDN